MSLFITGTDTGVAGGWMVPIRPDYFISDLAVAMKLPVLVVAYNRLGCLNHSALTVQSVVGHGLRCVGLVLNNAQGIGDIAALTNADILRKILDVPVLDGLGENLTELPTDWRLMLNSTIASQRVASIQSCKKNEHLPRDSACALTRE